MLSPYVIEEARRHLNRIAPTSLPHFENFLQLSEYENIVDPTQEAVTSCIELVRDAKDVPVALAAIQANVDYLVNVSSM